MGYVLLICLMPLNGNRLCCSGNATFSDLDDCPVNHVFWVNPEVTTGHMPVDNYGYIEGYGSMQRFTEYRGKSGVYIRMYINKIWTSWIKYLPSN